MEFLSTIKDYSLFVVYDHANFVIPQRFAKFPQIKLISVNDQTCVRHGYQHFITLRSPSAWDKAIYYFCEIDANYDYVWFLEDDVFVPSADTLRIIDLKYPDEDLLVGKILKNPDGNPTLFEWPWWNRVHLSLSPLPWFISMVCANRMSHRLLDTIKKYVKSSATLYFHEIMLPTISYHHGLRSRAIPELSTIVYRNNWQLEEIKIDHLYHPIKDLNIQQEYRGGT